MTNVAGQSIEGSTNIAPGSEFTLRVRSDSDTRPSFVKTTQITVDAAGMFAGKFDFSELSIDDEYTITSRQGDPSEQIEVDGTVVEEQTETPTEEPTEEPADGDTDDDTPGFGAIVALVALIAAALLATRRRP